jgi:hypothetical protein
LLGYAQIASFTFGGALVLEQVSDDHLAINLARICVTAAWAVPLWVYVSDDVNWRARRKTSTYFIGVFGIAALGLSIYAFVITRTTISDIFKLYSTSDSVQLVTVTFYLMKIIFVIQFIAKKLVKALVQRKFKQLVNMYVLRLKVAEYKQLVVALAFFVYAVVDDENEKKECFKILDEWWTTLENADQALTAKMTELADLIF